MLLRAAYTSRAGGGFEEDELLRLCKDAERRTRPLAVGSTGYEGDAIA